MMSVFAPPVVSVVLPVFNAELFLKQAVESIFSQTYTNFELLAINDGSTDSSLEILRSFNDTRLRVINNDKNQGLIYTLNKGIELSKGKYIARMDADDVSVSNRFQLQVDFLDQNPAIVLLGGYVEFIDDKNKVFKLIKMPLAHDEIMQKIFSFSCFIHPSVMFRASVVRVLGGFRSEALHAEDYDLWLRIVQRHRVANLPQILLRYRIHPDQISQKKIRAQRETADRVRFDALTLYKKTVNSDFCATVLRPSFWKSLFAKYPSLGNDYLNWIHIYRDMGRNDLARQLIFPAIVASPLCGDLYLECLPFVVSKIIRRCIGVLSWYFRRVFF